MTISLKKQLQALVNSCHEAVLRNIEKMTQMSADALSDLTQGSLVKETRDRLHCSPHDLTLSFSTDGSSAFKSAATSMWPIHVMLNELLVISRFQNLLLCGLWFGKRKPDMFLFLKAFVNQLSSMGCITWRCYRTGQALSSKVYAVCCIADAPARASVLNHMQFNGYYGCPWCYQRGTLKYPFTENARERTHRGVLHDMKAAVRSGHAVNGILGATPIALVHSLALV